MFGLKLAVDLSFHLLIVESDCKYLIDKLLVESHMCTGLGSVLTDLS